MHSLPVLYVTIYIIREVMLYNISALLRGLKCWAGCFHTTAFFYPKVTSSRQNSASDDASDMARLLQA